jgi:hypothetical protein
MNFFSVCSVSRWQRLSTVRIACGLKDGFNERLRYAMLSGHDVIGEVAKARALVSSADDDERHIGVESL